MYRSDPCYKFTWALDVCVRENSTDYRHLKEIETALDGLTTARAYGYARAFLGGPPPPARPPARIGGLITGRRAGRVPRVPAAIWR